MPLAGKPMVEWSIEAFRACESVRRIVVASPPGHAQALGDLERADMATSVGGDNDADPTDLVVVDGGATRAQSVANALAAVETELVAIHDAARPLLTPELVDALVAALAADADAVIAASPVTDTVKATRSTFSSHTTGNVDLVVEQTLDRARLWGAQTPQVFRTQALREALTVDDETRDAATDEAMLIERAGGKVVIHPSSAENLKVTTPLDLRVAELLLTDKALHPLPGSAVRPE